MKKEGLYVIGRNTSDGHVSIWKLGVDGVGKDFEKRFCETLARSTHNTVYVIRGEILRRYRCIEEIPVECVEGDPLPPGMADVERKLKETE